MTTHELGIPDPAVEWRTTPDGLYVVLAGEIDLTCRELLDQAIIAVGDALPGDLLVDLSAVTFFSSEGLNFLAKAAKLVVDDRGSVLTVRNPAAQVVRMIELFGMQDRLTVTQDDHNT